MNLDLNPDLAGGIGVQVPAGRDFASDASYRPTVTTLRARGRGPPARVRMRARACLKARSVSLAKAELNGDGPSSSWASESYEQTSRVSFQVGLN